MNRSRIKAKRALRLRLTLLYTFMVLSVVLLVGGLYLVVQGYRFNSYEGRLQQGGLVQFNSYPSGASIWLNGKQIDKKTQNKLTISPGRHKFSMWREGYNDWNVYRTVAPGDVLWLNYTRLVPKDIKLDTSLNFPAVTSSAMSYNNKTLAVVTDAAQPIIDLVNVGSETATSKQLALPANLYTAAPEGITPSFSLAAWARDNKYLLVKYTYEDKTEWLSVNTDNLDASKNITQALGVDALELQYSIGDANILFALNTGHELHRINATDRSSSGPIASNVSNFSLYDNNTVFYTTKPDENGAREAAYVTVGSSKARTIARYEDSPQEAPLAVRVNKYYGNYYVVVANGNRTTILTGEVPASDAESPAPFKQHAAFDTEAPVKWLGFSPDSHRFVYAQTDNGVVVYDLDMKIKYASYLPGQTAVIDWIDEFHYVAVASGSLTMYDFDGQNPRALASGASGNMAALMQNGRYLYTLRNGAEQGIDLTRVKMIVD